MLLIASAAAATEVQEEEARTLFQSGKAAFAAERYQAAYDLFKQAYLLSPEPALLYNMASALQALGRPHDAAEELRAYLRTRPDVSEREQIETRIRALEEAQRLLDEEKKSAPLPPIVEPSPKPTIIVVQRKEPPPPPKRNTKLIVILSTVGVVVVGGALGLGLGLGLHDWHTATTLGPKQATE